MTPRSLPWRFRWLAGLLLLLGAAPAGAQLLHVRITETVTGRPLAGAIVEVLDSTEAVVRQGLLGEDGGRSIPLPMPGTYHVRLRRIGFQPFVGPPILVPARSTVQQELESPARHVVLSALNVSAAPRCARDAFGDPAFVTLWEEVRKALTSTVLSRTESGLSTEIRAFRRRLDGDGNVTTELVGLPRTTSANRPFAARSADSLTRDGYIRFANGVTEFYAPDEQVLLSDEFLDTHCFRLQRGNDANEGELGVRFIPVNGRKVADIEGTVWLDSASAQLEHVEFWYWANLPGAVMGEDRSGGQIIFGRTPANQWIVTAWRLRMPHFEADRRLNWRSRPDWYEEVGGVVTPPRGDTTAPAPILLPYHSLLAPARLTGSVFDSLSMRPVRGASVWLVPLESREIVAAGLAPAGKPSVAPVVVHTDSAGHYEIPSVPAGPYELAFDRAESDSSGEPLPHYAIQLKPGTTLLGDVATPSLASMARDCARAAADSAPDSLRRTGLVTGMVTTAGDVRPLENAQVVVSWYDLSRLRDGIAAPRTPVVVQTQTARDGSYRVCGLPEGTLARVRAAGPHASTGEVQAQLDAYRVARVNLRLAEVDSGQPAPATIFGTVSDSIAGPVRDAVVAVDGTALEARTDSLGRFRIGGVTPGTQTLIVRRLGTEGARLTVDLLPGLTRNVKLSIVKAHLLEERLVTATRTSRPEVAAAERRHKTGVGTLIRAEQIAASPSLQSLFNGLPGVRTVNGRNGTDMQWIALMHKNAGDCEARLFIDGQRSSYDQLFAFTPAHIEAIEVYVRPGTAPIFTTGSEDCGVILMWTKR